MIGLEVNINGKPFATACVDEAQMLTFVLNGKFGKDEPQIHARSSGAKDLEASHEWPLPSIGVGDEITLKLVEVDVDTLAESTKRQIPHSMITDVKNILKNRSNQAPSS